MSDRSPAAAGETQRVVIAHDFAETYGGAERISEELAALWPEAPFYALLGRREVAERMGVADRFHTRIKGDGRLLRHYRWLAPVFPAIVNSWRLPAADLLVTSSYAYAHGLRTVNDAPQLCYCHTPLRFAWSQQQAWGERLPGGRLAAAPFAAFTAAMRTSDRRASTRVSRFLTQSSYIAAQIEEFYGREAHLVPPPVDCDRFAPDPRGPAEHFLFCGRLVEASKRPSLVIEAFNRMPDQRLHVVGDGVDRAFLEALAGPNVVFLGHLDDDALVEQMARCQAALFPSVDAFGLVPIEVAACGRPVFAYAAGGALHTIADGVSGRFFDEPTAEAIVEAVRGFDEADWNPNAIREHALQWDRRAFGAAVRRHADEVAGGRRSVPSAPA